MTAEELSDYKKKQQAVRSKIYRENNRKKVAEQNKRYRRDNPIKYMLVRAKHRAKKFELDFDLTVEDFPTPPSHCPVLNLELIYGAAPTGGRPDPCSASLDRFNNELGYVKGNCLIISWRANELKKNGTLDELKAVVKYMENGG